MANKHKIEINKRENLSRQGLKELRKTGKIPGIYYAGGSNNSIPIFITKQDLSLAIKSGARIFNIAVGEKKQNVLFKSVQYHPVTDEIIHIDLYGVRMDQTITIKVAIQFLGDAVGVKDEGGILNQPLNEIEIQCLPGDIPEMVELDISELGMGNSLNAIDIKLDEKFKLVTAEDAVVVSVTQPMKEIEPVIELDEDEAFLDEDGEPIGDAEDAEGAEGEKPSEEGDSHGEKSSPDKETNVK